MVCKINIKVCECVKDGIKISLRYMCLKCEYIGCSHNAKEKHPHGGIKYLCPYCNYVNHDHNEYINHREEEEMNKLSVLSDEEGPTEIPDGW